MTITKDQIIEMIENLKAKRTAALRTKAGATLEQCASVDRMARNIDSVCDRLAFNFNMSSDAATEGQQIQANDFLENTIAEAELWLQ